MDDREEALARSRREAQELGRVPLGEVTPSRRDFAQYVSTGKTSIEVIARIASEQGRPRGREELIAEACRCDDAEVAALSVSFGQGALGPEDALAIAAATTAPMLREDLCVDAAQIYHARLHGADAVVLPCRGLSDAALADLVDVARSLHMAVVTEATSADEVETALQIAHGIVAVRCAAADSGLDLNSLRPLLRRVPENRTVVVLDRIDSLETLAELRDACDAALVPASLCESEVGRAALQRLAGR
jgi:indole-3-glycerol phosphate synthase/phosphoribosylanthranilate isomerase